MVEFGQQYGTAAKAYRALYRARWPHGFRCPACDNRRRSLFRRGRQVYYQCREIRQGKYDRRKSLFGTRSCISRKRRIVSNRRFDPRAILPRLARAMMLCKPHPEPVLSIENNFHG
ncbi:transposase [Metallibacterium scheffleri]